MWPFRQEVALRIVPLMSVSLSRFRIWALLGALLAVYNNSKKEWSGLTVGRRRNGYGGINKSALARLWTQ